jgi:DNA-binding transcriptional MocR family regulator
MFREDHGIPRDNLIKIPVDDDGLQVEILNENLQKLQQEEVESDWQNVSVNGEKRFKYLLFLVPTFSNPTGNTLSLERRKQLVKLAQKYDLLVVCDDVYHLLHFNGIRPPPRVVAFDDVESGFGNVISNNSFSKLLSPGIRFVFSVSFIHIISSN